MTSTQNDTSPPSSSTPQPEASSSTATTAPLDEKSIIQKYNNLQNECSTLIQKITELQQDRNEHELVSETLQPLDPKRRAFRLIGGVLVERTVEDVLPSLLENLKNVSYLLNNNSTTTICDYDLRFTYCILYK